PAAPGRPGRRSDRPEFPGRPQHVVGFGDGCHADPARCGPGRSAGRERAVVDPPAANHGPGSMTTAGLHSGRARVGVAALLAAVTVTGTACGGHGHPEATGTPPAADAPRPQTYGHGALKSQAGRVVEVRMLDSLRFEPAHITVQRGEIVTFRLVNAGHL